MDIMDNRQRGTAAGRKRRRRRRIRPIVLIFFAVLVPTTAFGVRHLTGSETDENKVVESAVISEDDFDNDETVLNLESESTEIIFAYSTYVFERSFNENFNEQTIRTVLEDINTKMTTVTRNIDKDAAIYDTMAILRGEKDDIVVHLSKEIDGTPFVGRDLLGTFYTYFYIDQTARNANVRRASYFIDEFILLPGEIFSMNETIGPVNLDNGYEVALVIRDGDFVEGIGGGVCQVATTLYMAALYSELEIVQRRAHSRRVGYVPPAFDSVLATPSLDLRFRNDSGAPIVIEARTSFNRVTVNIWGHETRPAERTISFESVQGAANDQYATFYLYKVIDDNGSITRQRINMSTYRVEEEGTLSYYEAVGGEE